MKRLTHERMNGIKTGYWSPNKKQELVDALAAYENTRLTPEQIIEMDKMYTELAKEVMQLRKKNIDVPANDGWIPVEERLPEDGTYLCTFKGELCGIEEPFTGMCGMENGVWDEPGYVTAWQPLPEPYRPERSEGE